MGNWAGVCRDLGKRDEMFVYKHTVPLTGMKSLILRTKSFFFTGFKGN